MTAPHPIPEVRRRSLSVVALALASSLVLASCGDDDEICGEGDTANTTATLDSIGWIYETQDTLTHGRLTLNESSRFSISLYGWYSAWTDIQTVKSFLLRNQDGSIQIRGRLGLPDTAVYFLIDSIGVDPTDSKKGTIRMEFRSIMGNAYYYGYNYLADSSTFWNTRGSISCTHPLESGVSDIASFSCDIATKGDKSTMMNFRIESTKYHYEYECSDYRPMAVD